MHALFQVLYLYRFNVCVCVHVCVCVCARTCARVCWCEGWKAMWVCVHAGERGREIEEGGSLCVSVCAPVCYDLFRLFFKCTSSPIILKKIACYSIMFYTYGFTN